MEIWRYKRPLRIEVNEDTCDTMVFGILQDPTEKTLENFRFPFWPQRVLQSLQVQAHVWSFAILVLDTSCRLYIKAWFIGEAVYIENQQKQGFLGLEVMLENL